MELAPAIERLKELARLDKGRHGALAVSLLARLGPIDLQPCPGPPVQSAAEPIPELSVYVRYPRKLKVCLRKRDATELVLAHMAIVGEQAQTTEQIVRGTGLKAATVREALARGPFARDGIDGEAWRPQSFTTQGGSYAGSVS